MADGDWKGTLTIPDPPIGIALPATDGLVLSTGNGSSKQGTPGTLASPTTGTVS